MSEEWITTREAAEIANTSQDYIRILVRDGKVAAQKFGSTWMVDKKSLQEYYGKSWKNTSTPRQD